jgi:hypothetical protein
LAANRLVHDIFAGKPAPAVLLCLVPTSNHRSGSTAGR